MDLTMCRVQTLKKLKYQYEIDSFNWNLSGHLNSLEEVNFLENNTFILGLSHMHFEPFTATVVR